MTRKAVPKKERKKRNVSSVPKLKKQQKKINNPATCLELFFVKKFQVKKVEQGSIFNFNSCNYSCELRS